MLRDKLYPCLIVGHCGLCSEEVLVSPCFPVWALVRPKLATWPISGKARHVPIRTYFLVLPVWVDAPNGAPKLYISPFSYDMSHLSACNFLRVNQYGNPAKHMTREQIHDWNLRQTIQLPTRQYQQHIMWILNCESDAISGREPWHKPGSEYGVRRSVYDLGKAFSHPHPAKYILIIK